MANKNTDKDFLGSLDPNLDAKDQLKAVDEQFNFLKSIEQEYEKILEARRKGKTYDQDRLLQIQKEYGGLNTIQNKINDLADAFNQLSANMPDFEKELARSVENFDEMDTSLVSLGNMIGKNNALYKQHEQRVDNIKAVTSSISAVIQKNNDLTTKERNQLTEIANAYSEHEISVTNIQKDVAAGNIDREQAAILLEKESKFLENIISQFDGTSDAAKNVVPVLKAMTKESQSFAASAQKTQIAFKQLDNVFSNFSGIPAMQELGEVIKTNKANTVAFTGAMMALGAAIGLAAYKYFGAQFEIDRKINFDAQISGLELDKTLIENSLKSGFNLTSLPDADIAIGSNVRFDKNIGKKLKGIDFLQKEIGLQLLETRGRFVKETLPKLQQEAAYAGAKAAISFSDSFQQGAAQFKATAVTARFGEQLAKTGFSAGKLQLAGIDPTQISDAMSKLALETGKVPTAKLGAEMALIAKRTGQSVDGVASLAEYFQRTDNLSSETAVNMVEGMRAMAKASNLDLGNLMEGVAEASKDALSYQIKSGEALAKQVAASQSIGVNFNKLASAGRSMVLNYKDSIKSEMQLSSMLGRSVNLSEVRMKAMTGDYAGMMQALKEQGLNPADMNMFEQEAFSQAMGGMDLGTLDKIFKGEIKTAADLTAGNAGAAGAGFLEKTKQAQASLAAEQASISANTAILSAELENKMQEEFISKFGPGIEKFNAVLDSMKKQRDIEFENALKSTKAYSDLETQIEQAGQRFDLMGTVINSAIAIFAGGLGAFGANMASGTIFAKRAAAGTPTTQTQTSPKSQKQKGKNKFGKTKGGPKPSTSTGPKPKAKAGMSKNLKRAGIAGLILAGGYAAYNYFSNKGEEPQEEITQEPEVDRAEVQQQLKAEYLQSNGINSVAEQVGMTNDLLRDANSELAYTNKANVLSGVCSCISSNMQENMGMVVDQLKKAKEAENFAYKGAYAETQGEAFKGAVDTAKAATMMHVGIELSEKGYHKAKHKVEKVIQKRAAEKGIEKVEQTTGKTVGKSVFKKGAEYVGQKYTAALTTKAVAPLVSASKIISKGVNPAGWIGVGAEIAGEYMKGRGKEKADKGLYDTGRATQTAGATLAYGAMGATIGSIIPGIGTAVGAAIGGLFGLTNSLYSNYFSEDAKKEAAQIEEAETERLRIEMLNKQIDSLLAIQQGAVASAQSTMKSTNEMLAIAGDERNWRASMLLQTLEMTRLLGIISMDFLTKDKEGNFKDKFGNVVEQKNYDQLEGIRANMGTLTFKDDRQKNLASVASSFSEAAKKGVTELSFQGQKLNLEQYKQKYKVSDAEFKEATRIGALMSQQRTATVTTGPQVNVTGGQGGVGGVGQGGVGQGGVGGVGGKGGEGGVGGAAGNTTIDLSPISTHLLAIHGTLKQIEANILTQYVLQTTSFQKGEERHIAKTTMDAITNTTITNISTDIATIKSFMETQQVSGMGTAEIGGILRQIQMQAHARGIQMYNAEVKQVNNTAALSKEVVVSRTIEQKNEINTGRLVTINNSYLPNMEEIQIEMIKVLQDSTELLGAIARNTSEDKTTVLKLDGNAISRSVVDRQANRAAFNQSKRLKYSK